MRQKKIKKAPKVFWNQADKYYMEDKTMDTQKLANEVLKMMTQSTRDNGAEILDLIHSKGVKKVQQATGQLGKPWIEFVYELDLDKQTVTVYTDGGIEPAKVIPFSEFTVKRMAKLEKELYGNDE